MMEDEGMDSLYSEDSAPDKGKENPESIDQEEQEGTTAVVPMKLLQGKHPEPIKEGEEIVVKAVKVYGDEVEIAYSETKPGEIGEGGGEKDANAEIDAMSGEQSGGGGY